MGLFTISEIMAEEGVFDSGLRFRRTVAQALQHFLYFDVDAPTTFRWQRHGRQAAAIDLGFEFQHQSRSGFLADARHRRQHGDVFGGDGELQLIERDRL